MRSLFGSPVLLQDWDSEAEEGAAHYFELFLDLLLVAAASSVADQFKQDETFGEFSVFYFIMVNGWMLYTHHISTRFEDTSLAHSMLLFCYFIGFGYSIVNADFNDVHAFAAGALLQRASVLIMLANIAICLPRARYFSNILAALTVVAMVGLCFACWGGETVAVTGLWVAATVEFVGELILISFVDRRLLVPVNIERSKERLGALELIMMGETVLSVTLAYRELARDDIVHGAQNSYYWVLGLSYMLMFMFTLLFFHLQPAPNEHAFRRSAWHGALLLLAHKLLGLALLAVGVSVKLVVEAVLLQEELSLFAYRLMGWSVGAALLVLFLIRCLHFASKTEIHLKNKIWIQGQNPGLDRVMNLWWWTVGTVWLVPVFGIATGAMTRDPLTATTLHAALLFVLCVVESTYSHTIHDALSNLSNSDGERQSLLVDSTSANAMVA
jgi:hypothetical protein